MVQYTLAQSPEIILTVPGKDSSKAREKAMDQLMELMDEGKLPTDLADGFGPKNFIEIKDPTGINAGRNSAGTASDNEDSINQAVQILSALATLKLKAQESRTEALQVRQHIDVLFTDDLVTEEEINQLKEGFKVLKNYAQTNLRYRDARAQAEDARTVLDTALQSSEPESKKNV
ncbi:MAG: hypothetical protein KME43_04895 [Myxacorys chilensis ATA2-1-KO14]|jgi:hypothetical protein|nr:hypothetical protein [Myxacorys chilensis ATA2-1-KO14]